MEPKFGMQTIKGNATERLRKYAPFAVFLLIPRQECQERHPEY